MEGEICLQRLNSSTNKKNIAEVEHHLTEEKVWRAIASLPCKSRLFATNTEGHFEAKL